MADRKSTNSDDNPMWEVDRVDSIDPDDIPMWIAPDHSDSERAIFGSARPRKNDPRDLGYGYRLKDHPDDIPMIHLQKFQESGNYDDIPKFLLESDTPLVDQVNDSEASDHFWESEDEDAMDVLKDLGLELAPSNIQPTGWHMGDTDSEGEIEDEEPELTNDSPLTSADRFETFHPPYGSRVDYVAPPPGGWWARARTTDDYPFSDDTEEELNINDIVVNHIAPPPRWDPSDDECDDYDDDMESEEESCHPIAESETDDEIDYGGKDFNFLSSEDEETDLPETPTSVLPTHPTSQPQDQGNVAEWGPWPDNWPSSTTPEEPFNYDEAMQELWARDPYNPNGYVYQDLESRGTVEHDDRDSHHDETESEAEVETNPFEGIPHDDPFWGQLTRLLYSMVDPAMIIEEQMEDEPPEEEQPYDVWLDRAARYFDRHPEYLDHGPNYVPDYEQNPEDEQDHEAEQEFPGYRIVRIVISLPMEIIFYTILGTNDWLTFMILMSFSRNAMSRPIGVGRETP